MIGIAISSAQPAWSTWNPETPSIIHLSTYSILNHVFNHTIHLIDTVETNYFIRQG